jgi:AraC-like DNA-binding protein
MTAAQAGERFDAVHARVLHRFPELVASLGGDGRALLREAGITARDLTYSQVGALLENAARTLDCPDFGLRLATLQRGGLYGPLGRAMRHAARFGEALRFVATHNFAHSLAARIRPLGRMEDDSLLMGHDVVQPGMAERGQLMEQLLLVGQLMAIEMTGGAARAREVHFRHQPISPATTYRRHFGCEVRFGQAHDAALFSPAALAAPITASDAAAHARAAAVIAARFTRRTPPLHAEVRALIMAAVGFEPCSNGEIARRLDLHARTINRRLAREGTSFQRIKDEVRRDLMDYYLRRTGFSFTQISERLGFAEQSVFTRNCRRWLGASPSEIRRTRAGDTGAPRLPADCAPV